jgi:hypothetical protein
MDNGTPDLKLELTTIDGETRRQQQRSLRLELAKTRREVALARLEARAAAIELMLHHCERLAAGEHASSENIAEQVDRLPERLLPAVRRDGREGLDPVPASAGVPDKSDNVPVTPDDVSDLPADVPVTPDNVPPSLQTELPELTVAEQQPPIARRRGKRLAVLVSAIAHVIILLLLAGIAIRIQSPRDLISIIGSTTESHEVAVETFAIESSDPLSEPAAWSPSEVVYDESPVGTFAAAEIVGDATTPLDSIAAQMSPPTATAISLKSGSTAKIEFCGIEGGGNHFVYLVDSSKSMGSAFPSARRQLLASIAALAPRQRFYVIMYDRTPDYMRITQSDRDEPRSVYATPENKVAVAKWAAGISMDNGWAPYEPMKFALKLKPDVIFLLSDGEFPQRFEAMLQDENRVENLFGDAGPISIVHTISYHSKVGESRMKRIAAQNRGQYRHVPAPQTDQ